MKIVIALFVIAAVIGALIVYSCCVVAGRADDSIENIHRMEDDEERGDTDA